MLWGRRIVLALLALGPGEATSGHDGPVLRCRLSEARPVIDGILDEACWAGADVATGFMLLERRGRATQQTECRVTYDAENLYVSFVCLETDPSGILTRCTERDGEVWNDDCVEIFLDTRHDHRTYFHLIANRIATRFDEVGPYYPRPQSWDGDWLCATSAATAGWTIEFAIPFRALGLTMPRPGTLWGFNAHRQQHRLVERSSWSPTLHGFHEPRNFGHLLFVPQL